MRLQLIEVTKNCSVVQITGGPLIGCAPGQSINTNPILIFYIHDQRFFPLLITAPTDNSSCCIGRITNRNVFKHIFIERPTNYISTNQLFLQRQAIEKIMQQSYGMMTPLTVRSYNYRKTIIFMIKIILEGCFYITICQINCKP